MAVINDYATYLVKTTMKWLDSKRTHCWLWGFLENRLERKSLPHPHQKVLSRISRGTKGGTAGPRFKNSIVVGETWYLLWCSQNSGYPYKVSLGARQNQIKHLFNNSICMKMPVVLDNKKFYFLCYVQDWTNT